MKPVYQQITLSPWLGVAGMIILWHIRFPLLTLIFISVAFSPRQLGIGMHSQTLLSPLLKVLRMVLLSSLLGWELGTNLPVLVNDCCSDVSPVNISDSECVQRQAARSITGDYRSRQEGSVTKMLEILRPQSLENHRSASRLIFFYKVVEGLVPAVSPEEFFSQWNRNGLLKLKKFSDYKSSNIIERHIINHDRGFVVEHCVTDQSKNSFFVTTAEQWNHLDPSVVHSEIVEGFKTLLQQCY